MRTGVYYFERNREAFGAILYFYQSRGYIERPTCVSLDNFVEEILFFNLDYYVMVFIFKPTFYKTQELVSGYRKSGRFVKIYYKIYHSMVFMSLNQFPVRL